MLVLVQFCLMLNDIALFIFSLQYFSGHMRFLVVLVFGIYVELCRVDIIDIIRVVKHEYNEFMILK